MADSSSTGAPAAAADDQPTSAPAAGPFTPPKLVFVAGATGRTGQRVVRELVKRGVSVRAGVRSKEKGAVVLKDMGVDDSKVELVLFDLTSGVEALASAMGSDVDAVVCAAGWDVQGFDLTRPWKIDNLGTIDLVKAAQKNGTQGFVLVSSILTNGAASWQFLNPMYILLNLFGLILVAKLQAERYIEKSGINYTIVRPGGLNNKAPSGNIVMTGPDKLFGGMLSRDQVADVVVEALFSPAASFKTVEIISKEDAPQVTIAELYSSVC